MNGYTSAEAADDVDGLRVALSADKLFPNVAQAGIAYRMLGQGDQPVGEWEHVYILRRGEAWRVSLTIADGEMAA